MYIKLAVFVRYNIVYIVCCNLSKNFKGMVDVLRFRMFVNVAVYVVDVIIVNVSKKISCDCVLKKKTTNKTCLYPVRRE